MQQQVLNVDDEIKALGDAFKGLIMDIKAGKSVISDLSDAILVVVPAVQSVVNAPVDLKKVDNQAYLLWCLANALEPQPA